MARALTQLPCQEPLLALFKNQHVEAMSATDGVNQCSSQKPTNVYFEYSSHPFRATPADLTLLASNFRLPEADDKKRIVLSSRLEESRSTCWNPVSSCTFVPIKERDSSQIEEGCWTPIKKNDYCLMNSKAAPLIPELDAAGGCFSPFVLLPGVNHRELDITRGDDTDCTMFSTAHSVSQEPARPLCSPIQERRAISLPMESQIDPHSWLSVLPSSKSRSKGRDTPENLARAMQARPRQSYKLGSSPGQGSSSSMHTRQHPTKEPRNDNREVSPEHDLVRKHSAPLVRPPLQTIRRGMKPQNGGQDDLRSAFESGIRRGLLPLHCLHVADSIRHIRNSEGIPSTIEVPDIVQPIFPVDGDAEGCLQRHLVPEPATPGVINLDEGLTALRDGVHNDDNDSLSEMSCNDTTAMWEKYARQRQFRPFHDRSGARSLSDFVKDWVAGHGSTDSPFHDTTWGIATTPLGVGYSSTSNEVPSGKECTEIMSIMSTPPSSQGTNNTALIISPPTPPLVARKKKKIRESWMAAGKDGVEPAAFNQF
jgi:hypothetical protein